MITKEQFVAILKTLEEYDKKEQDLSNAMTAMCSDFFVHFYPLSRYKSIIIDLLKQMFYNKTEFQYERDFWSNDIDYFIYDLDYGKNWKEDSYTEADGTPIDISTAEKLYDYLIKENK